jgi:N-acyl-D-aspartate/D-glutamate deacylase
VTDATLVIRHATVFDGTGSEPVQADIAIRDDRIVEFGPAASPATERGMEELDASGLYAAPGFIDIHSHSDYTLLVDPRAVSAIHQGVTLEVVGNCGHGCFPISNTRDARRAIYGVRDAPQLTWNDARGYFDTLERAEPAVNVISLVPNGQLRLSAVGLCDRQATAAELRSMIQALEESLEAGAWGYSTGLEYAQERGAPEAEVAALATTCARHDALYATHTRRRDAGAAEAVEEAVRTARSSSVRLQVSHLIPRNGLDEGRRCIESIDAARGEGLDIAFDMHTRLYGTTYLHTALPPALLAESLDGLRSALSSPATRRAVAAYESILSAGGDWSRIVLLDNEVMPEYSRRDVASIASEREQAPIDTVCDLLQAALPDTTRLMVINLCHSELQQRETFTHPLCMPGSDAMTLAPNGPLAGTTFHGSYTWASWFYRSMVRDEGLLTPAEAVHRLTGMPAARLGINGRGTLRVGAPADVVLFDPATFAEHGTTFEPNQLASGVRHVFVNGVWTLRDGELTGSRAGRVLRRQ